MGSCGELWGAVGSCGELLGAVGSCWELLGAVGSCWELLGVVGSCWELLELEGVVGVVGFPEVAEEMRLGGYQVIKLSRYRLHFITYTV